MTTEIIAENSAGRAAGWSLLYLLFGGGIGGALCSFWP